MEDCDVITSTLCVNRLQWNRFLTFNLADVVLCYSQDPIVNSAWDMLEPRNLRGKRLLGQLKLCITDRMPLVQTNLVNLRKKVKLSQVSFWIAEPRSIEAIQMITSMLQQLSCWM